MSGAHRLSPEQQIRMGLLVYSPLEDERVGEWRHCVEAGEDEGVMTDDERARAETIQATAPRTEGT